MKFKYKGVIIDTPNIEKKLKRMKLTLLDVELVEDIKEVIIEDNSKLGITLYKYKRDFGYTVSVYDNLPYELIETKYY